MSRLTGYVVIFGVAAMPLGAQADLAPLARRVDAVHGTAIAAQNTLRAYRAMHPPRFAFDDSVTVASGKVKIYFTRSTERLARAGADGAGRQLATLGSALDRLSTYRIAVVPDTSASDYDVDRGRIGKVNVDYYATPGQREPFRTSTNANVTEVAGAILSTVGSRAGAVLAPQVGKWISGRVPIAPMPASTLDWGQLRLSMVSSPSLVGRACFLGDLSACRAYLGLDSVPDPARSLFDSTGRRLLVEYDADRMRSASRDGYTRCVNGNDDACMAVLHVAQVGPLSSPYVRVSLLTEALDRGGPGALERLLTATGSAGDAMAAAANEPLDSLVAEWQHHMNERFGASANIPLSVVLSSIAGIAICVFLALRSSRWR